ncbi:mucin-binding protein, partial [Lactobacillus amylovorus]|uniref:mucin-binding protein n=1 Tax=Lactobacillus amylovorus TaxID=1604 RepID=UPI003F8E1A04
QNGEVISDESTETSNDVVTDTSTETASTNPESVATNDTTVDTTSTEGTSQLETQSTETTTEQVSATGDTDKTQTEVKDSNETVDKKEESTDKDKTSEKETDKDKKDETIDLNAAISDGKVIIEATDPKNENLSNAGSIVVDDKTGETINDTKYIYQIVNLNSTGDYKWEHGGWQYQPDSKLILSVNRHDKNDKNIYAYVVDGDYNKVSQTIVIGEGKHEYIEINGEKYYLSNTGASNITINGSSKPTGSASTITGSGSSSSPIYNLGNMSSGTVSATGEIVPVYTENSVIKYYYRDEKGNLVAIEGSDKYPNIIVSGFTGQEFVIENVDQFKQIIDGFYLSPGNIPSGNFTGTLSQFDKDSYYKKVYYKYDSNGNASLDYYVVYNQTSAAGHMSVTVVQNGKSQTKVIPPGESVSFQLDGRVTYTARNPYVTSSPHEVQFVYSQLGSIIPVDEETGKEIEGFRKQFNNDKNDATKAGATEVPVIDGYELVTVYPDGITPEDAGTNVTVLYRKKRGTANVVFVDQTTGTQLDKLTTSGQHNTDISFSGDLDPAKLLQIYLDKGYELAGAVPIIGGKFDAENEKTFTITLKHGVITVTPENPGSMNPEDLKDEVNRVIEYVYADGTTAKPSVTQTVNFKGTAYIDKVTGQLVNIKDGKIEVDENGKIVQGKITWVANDGTTFEEVISPTIDGYTPDKDKVDAEEGITPDSESTTIRVVYNANAEKAEITYIDDTTGEVIRKDIADGVFDGLIKFDKDPSEMIAELEKKGYVVVSNNFTSGTKFGDSSKDENVNHFVVRLTHGYIEVKPGDDIKKDDPIDPDNPDGPKYSIGAEDLNKDINRVIEYVYADGSPTGITSVTQTVNFKGTAYIDKVTGQLVNIKDGKIEVDENGKIVQGKITWVAVDGTTFEEVISPTIDGYTPDKDKVDAEEGITPDSESTTIRVVYTVNSTPTPDPDPTPTPDPDPDDPYPEDPATPPLPEDEDEREVPPHGENKPGKSGNSGNAGGNTANSGVTPLENAVRNNSATPENVSTETTDETEENQTTVNSTNEETLPQTGEKENKAGIFGLLLATVGSLFGLAGSRKRKNK